MNKKDFIEAVRQSTDFPSKIDAETVCSYLESNLSENVETDPAVFLRCMKLSFDIFNHIKEAEVQKHLEGLMDSIGEAINYSENNTTQVIDDNLQTTGNKTDKSSDKDCKKQKCCGLWQKICARKGAKKIWGIIAFISVFVLLLPLIVTASALCLFLYTVPIITATTLMLAVLVPTIVLAVLAIIALSYGIAALFTSLPIGIMEIGLGTVLFSLTIALWAINLGFFTFIVPFLSSKIACFIKKTFSRPISFVFGKEVK